MNQFFFKSDDELTTQIIEAGIVTWNDLVRSVQNFHYARNANRFDLDLVWHERKGTCSSKHAFLKHISELNKIPNVKLFLAFYKMDAQNTPGVGNVLNEYSLEFIPEAHCYLKINEKVTDITNSNSDFEKLRNDILEEISIEPNQVADFKIDYHQKFLKNWIIENQIPFTFEEIWNIREKCIKKLSELS